MPTPTEPVEEHPHDTWDHEDGGGPIKSFLEHLEDLRWVLIKCAVTVFVSMIVCLLGANKVVKILEWPLKQASVPWLAKNHHVTVKLGTNLLGSFTFQTNVVGEFDLGTNHHMIWQIEPIQSGTNFFVGVRAVNADSSEPPATDLASRLVILGPAAAFFVAFKVAFYAGIVISSPLLFFFIGGFVFPALKMHEKAHVYRGMFVGTLLFMMGVSFCYFALMPMALKVSAQYSNWLGFSAEIWRAEEYLSFVCKFMLGMGLGFELPVVLLTLVKIGVLDYRTLKSFRRYMIVVNLVLGAVLTTPEVITQLMMFVPLQLLYEVSVFIAWRWDVRDRKKAAMNRQRT